MKEGRRPGVDAGRRPRLEPTAASSPSAGRGLDRLGRRRAAFVLLVVTAAFALVAVKLTFIQGVHAHRYLQVGQSEWTQTLALPAERGAILDRNGQELAQSAPRTTIYADPHQVTDAAKEAAALSGVLSIPAAKLQTELSEHSGFVYLARTVDDATAARVAGLKLPGVASLPEPERFYPAGTLAAPLLGVVGTDGTGLSGLEYRYNSLLAGTPGRVVQQIDPAGHRLPGGLLQYQAPVAGNDLVLTLDSRLQYDAEEALSKAIVAAKAHSGIALLMDSRTGEILADAQLTVAPGGNGHPVEAPSATAFTEVYEPGSVNKLITISAALQQGLIKPSDMFTIPNSYPVAGTNFHDAESHPTEYWNVTDILANSSNVGTIQIAQRLGETQLVRYLHAYGEGSMTDVGFPGESAGLLPKYWSGTTIATVPIGQGIGVTAVQMLAAYNTIANGGVYIAPRLVAGTIGPNGKEHLLATPAPRRVVSPFVAKEMTAMLDQVVKVGTGQAASLTPYTVAGKTGTAQIPSPSGGYEIGRYVASFAGFVPSEKPAITAMVVVDDTPDYGAAASAPTFAVIAQDALQLLQIPPQPTAPQVPGVPQTNYHNATAAGESIGAPLPGLTAPAGASPATGTG